MTQEGGHSPGWGSSAGRAVEKRKKEKGDMETMQSLLSERELFNIIMKNWVYLGFVSLKNNAGEQWERWGGGSWIQMDTGSGRMC